MVSNKLSIDAFENIIINILVVGYRFASFYAVIRSNIRAGACDMFSQIQNSSLLSHFALTFCLIFHIYADTFIMRGFYII